MNHHDICVSASASLLAFLANSIPTESYSFVKEAGIIGCLIIAIWALVQDRKAIKLERASEKEELLDELKKSREKYEKHLEEMLEEFHNKR